MADGRQERTVGTPSLSRRELVKRGIGALTGLGIGETIGLWPGETVGPGEAFAGPPRRDDGVLVHSPKSPHDYSRAERMPGVCLNCSTVCGIVGYVIDGKLIKLAGNPEDPNNGATRPTKATYTSSSA